MTQPGREFPRYFAKTWVLDDSTEILIRSIRPDDELLMAHFHATLSERSVYLRYFHMIPLDTRITHERLTRICVVDYHREIALVAEKDHEILAVGRLTKSNDANEAEFAVLISDKFQGHGLGTELVKTLLEIARVEGLDRVTADILGENRQMIEICRLSGFRLRHSMGEGVVKAELDMRGPTA
jgi:acetyltransferase